MKKKFLLMVVLSVMAVGLLACGKADKAVSGNQEKTEVKEEAKESTAAKSSEEKKAEAEKAYIAGLKKLGGTSFKMTSVFSMDSGLTATIQGEDGILFWVKPKKTSNLVTVGYNCSNNQLNINSITFNDAGEAQTVSNVPVDNFIEVSDNCRYLLSSANTKDGKEVLTVEGRDVAQSFGDGTHVSMRMIEIKDDGSLELVFDDGIMGAEAEDITLDYRNHYNAFMGTNDTQNEFDDLFYNGKLLTEKMDQPIYATISFQSYAGKIIADGGDYSKVDEITSKLYGPDSKGGVSVDWGEGTFETGPSFR